MKKEKDVYEARASLGKKLLRSGDYEIELDP